MFYLVFSVASKVTQHQRSNIISSDLKIREHYLRYRRQSVEKSVSITLAKHLCIEMCV